MPRTQHFDTEGEGLDIAKSADISRIELGVKVAWGAENVPAPPIAHEEPMVDLHPLVPRLEVKRHALRPVCPHGHGQEIGRIVPSDVKKKSFFRLVMQFEKKKHKCFFQIASPFVPSAFGVHPGEAISVVLQQFLRVLAHEALNATLREGANLVVHAAPCESERLVKLDRLEVNRESTHLSGNKCLLFLGSDVEVHGIVHGEVLDVLQPLGSFGLQMRNATNNREQKH